MARIVTWYLHRMRKTLATNAIGMSGNCLSDRTSFVSKTVATKCIRRKTRAFKKEYFDTDVIGLESFFTTFDSFPLSGTHYCCILDKLTNKKKEDTEQIAPLYCASELYLWKILLY